MIKVTYLGHSGFLAELEDVCLILTIIRENCQRWIRIKKWPLCQSFSLRPLQKGYFPPQG